MIKRQGRHFKSRKTMKRALGVRQYGAEGKCQVAKQPRRLRFSHSMSVLMAAMRRGDR